MKMVDCIKLETLSVKSFPVGVVFAKGENNMKQMQVIVCI